MRWALGLLLLTAAMLKGHQLATSPAANKDIFTFLPAWVVPGGQLARWSLMLQVELELVFAIWLLSGLHKRLAWAAAMLCFVLFCGVTLYKGLSGEVSCGCFGKLGVHPWYTLVLDAAAALALLIFRPDMRRPQATRHYRPRLAAALGISLVLGVSAAIAMGSYSPTVLTAEGDTVGDGQLVVLEPEGWVGKRVGRSLCCSKR